MASKKECDRCKTQAPYGTLKGWGTVAIRDFGATERDDQRPHTTAELCPDCKDKAIKFVTGVVGRL